MAEFAQKASDHIRQLRALPDREISGAVQRQDCLLVFRFHLDEPHCWPADGLADRFSISCVGLAALYIGFDIGC